VNFHVVTLFPEVIEAYTNASILGRGQKEKHFSVKTYQLRDFAGNPVKAKAHGAGKWVYKRVDDKPYGGGPGMVLRAEPVIKAVEAIQKKLKNTREAKPHGKVIITSAGGRPLTNAYAKSLLKHKDVIFVCGRYEGIDARAKKVLKAEEVSVGDYILTGGEVPALAIIDASARQIKGVLGKFESLEETRVASHEIYTRPDTLIYHSKKFRVPRVLLSGNHAKMDAWKKKTRPNVHSVRVGRSNPQ
jgi:tRNA (guanine37-N1)-methyltransferase